MTTTLESPETARLHRVTSICTAEELEAMPSHRRVELVRGELSTMPNNSAQHGSVTFDLSLEVGAFVKRHQLGRCFAAETRFILGRNPDTVLGADFAFVAGDRLQALPPKGYLELAPDLIFETRSPGDTRRAFALKISVWMASGVKLAWAVDPKTKTVTVHEAGQNPRTLGLEDTLTGETVLPGFEFQLQRLFL